MVYILFSAQSKNSLSWSMMILEGGYFIPVLLELKCRT